MERAQSTSLLVLAVALVLSGCAAQKSKGDSKSQSQSQTQTSSGSGSKAPATASGQQPAPAPASGTNSMPDTTRTASAAGQTAQTGGGRAMTPDERRAAIDQRLEGSLGTFDDTLRREQKAVAEERDANEADQAAAAASSTSEPSDSESKSGEESGSAKPEAPPSDSSEAGRNRKDNPARPGDLKSDKERGAENTAGGSGAAAQKIPDGSDDDIVAKRLRKAAEQETDPELKEKLWKEYIEYKKNAGK